MMFVGDYLIITRDQDAHVKNPAAPLTRIGEIES
jgi:hypothetical protein